MTAAKARTGGAWSDSDLAGKVRVSGAWVDFGPAGGPSQEAIAWPNEPTLTNALDFGNQYMMGIQFHLLTSKNCVGVRWRVPDTAPAPLGGSPSVHLFNAGTQAPLATKAFTPVPGGYQDVLFDTPVALSIAPSEYVAAVWTDRYVFSAPTPTDGWLVRSPSLNVRGDRSRLSGPPEGGFPGGDFTAWYYVSPLVEV